MAKSFLGLSSDALKKYRSLIISLILLVLLAVTSILTSLFLSSQYNKAFTRYSAMSSAIEMHNDYIIALQAVEDENKSIESRVHSAKIAAQLFDKIKNFYPAFSHGGSYQYGYDNLTHISDVAAPLDAQDAKRIEDLYAKVKLLILNSDTGLIEKLRRVDAQTLSTDTQANQALMQELSPIVRKEVNNWEKGFVIFNQIRDDYQARAKKFDDLNKIITTVSIAVLLLYLAAVGLGNLRRLAKSDEEVEQARRETDDIMKNVNTGLFLLDKDLKIGNQYSAQLEKILSSKDIAGQNLTKVLSSKVSAKDLETTSEFVEQLYNNLVREKLLGDLNPLQRIMVMDDKQKSHYLDFKFSRIYHEKEIEKILVSVQDITAQVKLEQKLEYEREQNSLQVDMLSSILNVSPTLIEEFIHNTKQNVQKINNILKQSGASQADLTDKLTAMYRIMHSLKGEASALKLHNFVKIATEFEEKLKNLQSKSTLSGNEFLPLTIHLDEMLQLTNTIDALGKRISESAVHHAAQSKNVISKTDDLVDNISILSQDMTARIDNNTQFYQQLVDNIAARQNKKVVLNIQGLQETHLPKAIESVLKEVNIQLLRNAVVHGIEIPTVRLENGKSETGHISLKLGESSEDYSLILEDDGQGIDYDAIRERALEMGFDKNDILLWTNNKLIALLFKPGFSTSKDNDEDSGRGVGMDIIKAHIQQLNGKIAINTETGKFTRFTIKIPKNST